MLIRQLLLILFLLPSLTLAQTPFVDVSDSAGIAHEFVVYEGMFGGGICVLDYDKDGFEDLYLTSGTEDDQLYHNNGDGTFRNVFVGSGLELTRRFVTQGVAGADVNRDGWVDLFITTITMRDSELLIPRAHNLLFLNQGDGTFQDATAAFGLDKLVTFSTGPNFGDFNADGYPDLYVGNYFHEYEGGLNYISDETIVNSHQTAKGHLLLNKEGKTFVNVYEEYGLDQKGFGFGGVFTDFDNDGDQDLFINHDFGYKRTPDLLLENRYPRASFRDVAEDREMNLKINSMGTAIGDYNFDGFLDYYISNIKFNWFMVSQGEGKPYKNMAKELGMNYVSISWGSNFADFDHDGDLDLYVANGDLNPNCVPMGDYYFELDQGKFTEKARAMGLQDYGIGRGSVVFDMENDGDLDILVINQKPTLDYPTTSTTRLYRNDLARGNWLKVELQGLEADPYGLGSRVTAIVDGVPLLREIDGGGSSHMSQNSTIAHFGLGDADTVETLIVKWTGGKEQVLTQVAANQLVTIVEAKGSPASLQVYVIGGLGLLLIVGLFFWWRKKRSSSL